MRLPFFPKVAMHIDIFDDVAGCIRRTIPHHTTISIAIIHTAGIGALCQTVSLLTAIDDARKFNMVRNNHVDWIGS